MGVLQKKLAKGKKSVPIDKSLSRDAWNAFQEFLLTKLVEKIPMDRAAMGKLTLKSLSAADLLSPDHCERSVLQCAYGLDVKAADLIISCDAFTAKALHAASFAYSDGFEDTLDAVSKSDFKATPLELHIFEDLCQTIRDGIADNIKSAANYSELQSTFILSDLYLNPKIEHWVHLPFPYSFDLEHEGKTSSHTGYIYIDLPKGLHDAFLDDYILQTGQGDETACPPLSSRPNLTQTPTPLRALLEELDMSVAQCTRLEIGEVIPLPGISVNNIRVQAEMHNGNRLDIAKARLGIFKSNKALKIQRDVNTQFLRQ